MGFSGGAIGKEPVCQCRRHKRHKREGLIPGSGRSLGGRHGNPLQYSCLENPMDGGAWWAAVHRVSQNWTQLKQLSTHACRRHAGDHKLKYQYCLRLGEVTYIVEGR